MLAFLRHHFLAIIVFSLATLVSLFSLTQHGVLLTHDGIFHNIRAVKMLTELTRGYFPVRWVFSLDNNYGMPLFNYVYPLPYYLTAPLQLLGLSNVTSLKLITLLSYFLGGFGFYLLGMRAKLKQTISLLIGLIYLFIPYQFVNIFVRGSIGETLVLGLAPWVLISLQDTKVNGLRWYSPLALTLAMLAHNFMGLFLAFIIFVYTFIYKSNKAVFISILLSVLLASFFLLPMILESKLLLSTLYENFSFNFSDHFIYPQQFIFSRWGYLFSRPGIDQDGMTFQLGYGALVVLVASFIQLLKNKQYFWLVIFLGAIYLMTPYSLWLWQLLPWLQVIQFPWRLLGITTMVTGFLLLTLSKIWSKTNARHLTIFLIFTLIISLYNTWNFHQPRKIYSSAEFTREYSHYQALTTTSFRQELVPKWAPIERYQSTNPSLVTHNLGLFKGPANLEVLDNQAGYVRFIANAENDSAIVIYYQNYFPSWSGTIDGESLKLQPSETGEILLPLASGKHEYTIKLGSTFKERLANDLSLLAIAFLIIVEWNRRRKG